MRVTRPGQARLRGRSAAVLAALALGAAGLASAGPAVAVEPVVTPGTLLPAHAAPPGTPNFESASADYVALRYGQDDETRNVPTEIRDAATGAVVQTIPHDASLGGPLDPILAGPVLVTLTETAAGSGIVGRATFRNLATGAAGGSVDVPAGDHFLAAGQDLLVSAHPEDTAHTSPPETVHLLGADGSDRLVAGLPQISDPVVKALAGDHALLTNGSALWLVDLAAATAVMIVSGEAWGPYNFAALTPTKVIWQSGGRSYVETPPVTTVASRPLAGGAVTTVEVRTYGDLVAAGDGLGVIENTDDGMARLRHVSPADGTLGATVQDRIKARTPTAEGSLWLAVANTPAGTLQVDELDGLRTVAALPQLRMQVRRIKLDGDRVVATWVDPAVPNAWPVLATLLSAGSAGTWSAIGDPALVEPTGGGYSEAGSAAGGVSVFQQPDQLYYRNDRHSRVVWPGGERDVLTWYGESWLGRGGKVLLRRPIENDPALRLEDPRTGTLLSTVANPGIPYAVDGLTLWQPSGTVEGGFTARDLATGVSRTVYTDLRCTTGSLDVAGRWALVVCVGGTNGPGTWLVDLDRLVPAWQLTMDNANYEPHLGNGFVAWVHNAAAQYQPVDLSVVVADLTGAHPRRSYGPIRGNVYPPGPGIAADDAGGRRLVYLDPQQQPRLVTLDWLGTPPVRDVTAPALLSAATTSRVAAGTSLGFAYRFSDAVGVVSYDLEYREAPLGVGPGAWLHPASWYGAKATSVVRTAPAGSDTCFHVRARDAAGNVSAWSPPVCEAAPLDDKALATSGTVRRVATTAVPSGQVSTLVSAGSALAYKAVRTNHLAIHAQLGPGQGAVDVYVGTRKVGRASFAATKASWGTVWLPATAVIGGQLKLVRVGSATATVDWVGIAQQ